jgi:hypothetical protein
MRHGTVEKTKDVDAIMCEQWLKRCNQHLQKKSLHICVLRDTINYSRGKEHDYPLRINKCSHTTGPICHDHKKNAAAVPFAYLVRYFSVWFFRSSATVIIRRHIFIVYYERRGVVFPVKGWRRGTNDGKLLL